MTERNDNGALAPWGARELARKIEAYWRDRGAADVECRVEDAGAPSIKLGPIAVVRSNLVNGLPPRKFPSGRDQKNGGRAGARRQVEAEK